METATGMLLKSRITAHVQGTIQMLGREIPVNIQSKVTVDGKRLK